MRKYLKFLTMAILPLAFSLHPSALFSAGVGTTAGQFLRVGLGARAVGLGGAFSALADDVTAIYWNPAGLAQIENREVSLRTICLNFLKHTIIGLRFSHQLYQIRILMKLRLKRPGAS